MPFAVWGDIVGYLKKQPYWNAIEPFVLVGMVTAAAEVAAFQHVRSQYALTSVRLFLTSYVSLRILAVAAGLLAVMSLWRLQPRAERDGAPGRLAAYLRTHAKLLRYRAMTAVAVIALVVLALLATAPSAVGRVTIRLSDLPAEVQEPALVYIVYEMNRLQREWFFDVDVRPLNVGAFAPDDYRRCHPADGSNPLPSLCDAEVLAAQQGPIILVTSQPLGGDVRFATHRGMASVITTADASYLEPISHYEYLAYMIVLQSMLLQMDANGGLPPHAFEAGAVTSGGAFEFSPREGLFKAAMLAPRLSPAEEALLANRFGSAYLGLCTRLLSLDWLRAEAVRSRLDKLFKVTLSH